MYGKHHVLAYKAKGENEIVWGLSFRQLGWLVLGATISVKLATSFLPIPGIGTWGYLPYWLPFGISLLFSHVKHPPTGMSFGKYMWEWVKCRRTKRLFHR